jgi:hypothetical protein
MLNSYENAMVNVYILGGIVVIALILMAILIKKGEGKS